MQSVQDDRCPVEVLRAQGKDSVYQKRLYPEEGLAWVVYQPRLLSKHRAVGSLAMKQHVLVCEDMPYACGALFQAQRDYCL